MMRKTKSETPLPSPSPPGPPLAPPIGTPVQWDQARRIFDAAAAAALRIGVPNAIAVVEPNGELVLFAKMDGAPYSAVDLAQQKAVAAARYRRPTKMFHDAIQNGHLFFLNFPNVSVVPGGEPLIFEGKLIGAVGVSGGNADQDITVCAAGANAL